jgi:hypothetical protein
VTRSRTSAAENNEAIGKSTSKGLEGSSYVPRDFDLAESFGGGSEYLPYLRPPVWPFTSIQLVEQEDE